MPTLRSAWAPSVQDVANLVPHRTGDPDGAAQGTFTATTVPTAAQVQGLIRQVQSEVEAEVGDELPPELTGAPAGGTVGEGPAGHVVALGAASYVETQFYGTSPNDDALWPRFLRALAALRAGASGITSGGDVGSQLGASYAFPDLLGTGVGASWWSPE